MAYGKLVSAYGKLVSAYGKLVSAYGKLVSFWWSHVVHRFILLCCIFVLFFFVMCLASIITGVPRLSIRELQCSSL